MLIKFSLIKRKSTFRATTSGRHIYVVVAEWSKGELSAQF